MIEPLLELLFEIFGEVLLQIILQALAEAGLHIMRRPASDVEERTTSLLVLGYALLGAAIGGLSLLIFPHSHAHAEWARIATLVATSPCTGLTMAALGAWRRGRGQQTLPLDRFAYGCLLGVCSGGVRYLWAG